MHVRPCCGPIALKLFGHIYFEEATTGKPDVNFHLCETRPSEQKIPNSSHPSIILPILATSQSLLDLGHFPFSSNCPVLVFYFKGNSMYIL